MCARNRLVGRPSPQHPNMTFIVGENGSGKSAVFAAIQVRACPAVPAPRHLVPTRPRLCLNVPPPPPQVCLGARANSTHRADKLSDLVNLSAGEGSKATVRVTLSNTGARGRVCVCGQSGGAGSAPGGMCVYVRLLACV